MSNCECGLNCKNCQFCSSPVCECYCYSESADDDFDDDDKEVDTEDEDDYRDYYDD